MGRYQGRRDADLSPLGRVQSQSLAAALHGAGIERIVTSPLQRAVLTARPLAELLGVTPELDAAAIEIAHGTWEGRYREEIAENDPERYHLWRERPELVAFEFGETVLEVLERWRRFAARFDAGRDALIVTHDVVVRLAILDSTGRGAAQLWQPRVVNAGYAEFRVEGERWELLRECVDGHLAGCTADLPGQAL